MIERRYGRHALVAISFDMSRMVALHLKLHSLGIHQIEYSVPTPIDQPSSCPMSTPYLAVKAEIWVWNKNHLRPESQPVDTSPSFKLLPYRVG